MEVGAITPAQAAEKTLAAWAAAVEALHADAPPTAAADVHAVGADGLTAEPATLQAQSSMPVSEPALPGVDSDHGHEAATLQTLWRAPPALAEAPRLQAAAPPDVSPAQADLALPDALLAPATLTGLRTEPSLAWSLPTPPMPWQPPPGFAERRRQSREQASPQRPPQPREDDEPTQPLRPAWRESAATQAVIDADDDAAWCESLTRALRALLERPLAPAPLLAAREQWERGRCVVLAHPQGADPSVRAWAHVLWPHPDAQGQLALRGLRVDARLQWRVLPPARPWCHARLVREHHPRHGRQMVAADPIGAAGVLPCEVQLGPVLERTQRLCEVRVHVSAAQRFWAALGRQWSVHAIVSARPLLVPLDLTLGETPC